jgi:2-amino-4-hydroxy-6-hydroxymethyldihydropteridine diphosphokinase
VTSSSPDGEIVLFALGANLGDPLAQLRTATRKLADSLTEMRTSAVYRTPPVGGGPQPDYLNAVVRGRTHRSPKESLALARKLEEDAGRTRPHPNGPRTLDVDLLFHGAAVIHETDLVVPHPRWSERAFVVVPLLDVASEWQDPETGRTVAQVASTRGWSARAFPRILEPGHLYPTHVP